jgi:hypothetical protein
VTDDLDADFGRLRQLGRPPAHDGQPKAGRRARR